MKTFFFNCIIFILLFVNSIVLLCTVPSHIQTMREMATEHEIEKIIKHLDVYRQSCGSYPQRLADIPHFDQDDLLDMWGIPLHYECLAEKDKFVLQSVEYNRSLTQGKMRLVFHLIATGCMASLVLLILIIRFRKDGRWPVKQSLPLLFSFLVGLYARLGDNGILPMGEFVLWFYALLTLACLLPVFALIMTITKRDMLYFATLAVAPYTVFSVLFLVA